MKIFVAAMSISFALCAAAGEGGIKALSSAIATTITLEADPNGEGEWYPVADYRLSAGETRTEVLPPWVNASWLRVRSSANTIATAQFTYE